MSGALAKCLRLKVFAPPPLLRGRTGGGFWRMAYRKVLPAGKLT